MRASGISAFTKNVPSLSRRGKVAGLAATVLLAGGVQLLGAGSAWACGNAGDPFVTTINNPVPRSISVGGPAVEIDITFSNLSQRDSDKITAPFGVDPVAVGGATDPGKLRTGDLSVEATTDKNWTKLDIIDHCGGTWADTFPIAKPFPQGEKRHIRYRLALGADIDPKVARVSVFLGLDAHDKATTIELPVERTKSGPAPKPSASAGSTTTPGTTKPSTNEPSTAVSAPAPAAATPGATATPTVGGSPVATPTATAAPARLAETGGSRSTGPLIGAGGALVLLGAGGLLVARRRARR
ncbi:hypothetical protein [Streptomyces sp. CB03911]|uniref:hypothetical protein n=1 Tax=Streptomyces sp. CB03911 TaxID=1804758 RepID=UPI00093BA0D6|nr:hypothetical protein [Streptomyces sp. CB03911]OKI24102.1 hypothetical protein A6A07_04110 [Streptomyces sp. CB03911]